MKKTDFSTTLQELRRERKITQEQLASYLGVSSQAVSKWENGSYPEGDLLPKIADYFNVSIDYLYKRGVKNKSFEQEVLEELRKIVIEESEKNLNYGEHPEYWEQAYRIIWAIQSAPWINNKVYGPRLMSDDPNAKAASVLMDNSGYSFLSLNKNKEFYFLTTTPKTGYGEWLKNQQESERLFELLSEEDNVKILMYLCTMGYGEYASGETVSEAIGVDIEKVNSLLKNLSESFTKEENGHHPITTISIVNNEGNKEKAYGIDINLGGLLVGLFAMAEMFMNPVAGYHMQISNRSKAWIERGEL